MKRSHLLLLVVLTAALSALVTSLLTRSWTDKPLEDSPQAEAPAPDQDFHRWLHQNLALSPAQKKTLQPAEERFEAAHHELLTQLENASSELAHALGETGDEDPDLTAIMAKRHQLQGQIQELVVSHLLEKRAILTSEQKERYRLWIHESINHDHGD